MATPAELRGGPAWPMAPQTRSKLEAIVTHQPMSCGAKWALGIIATLATAGFIVGSCYILCTDFGYNYDGSLNVYGACTIAADIILPLVVTFLSRRAYKARAEKGRMKQQMIEILEHRKSDLAEKLRSGNADLSPGEYEQLSHLRQKIVRVRRVMEAEKTPETDFVKAMNQDSCASALLYEILKPDSEYDSDFKERLESGRLTKEDWGRIDRSERAVDQALRNLPRRLRGAGYSSLAAKVALRDMEHLSERDWSIICTVHQAQITKSLPGVEVVQDVYLYNLFLPNDRCDRELERRIESGSYTPFDNALILEMYAEIPEAFFQTLAASAIDLGNEASIALAQSIEGRGPIYSQKELKWIRATVKSLFPNI